MYFQPIGDLGLGLFSARKEIDLTTGHEHNWVSSDFNPDQALV